MEIKKTCKIYYYCYFHNKNHTIKELEELKIKRQGKKNNAIPM